MMQSSLSQTIANGPKSCEDDNNSEARLPSGILTDPNSIYRKLYNRNMEFFLWVLEKEPAPFIFKLHVQAQNKSEMKVNQVKRSV